jgi:hypothetical protein
MPDCDKPFQDDDFEEHSLKKSQGGFKINKRSLVRYKYYLKHKYNKVLPYQELKKTFIKFMTE